MPEFKTFDLGNVLSNAENIKGARIRNRVGQMQLGEMEEQQANRQKRQQIMSMVDDMPGKIEALRNGGFGQEAMDLSDQYLKHKKIGRDVSDQMSKGITVKTYPNFRRQLIQNGAMEASELPANPSEGMKWLEAQKSKAKSEYKMATRKYGKDGKTMAVDFPIIDGVPGQESTPYQVDKGKGGAGRGQAGGLKASDSNAIASGTASLFGGVFDPQTGQITGLGKDEQQRVLAIAEEAERLYQRSPQMGHRQAVAQAARNADIDIQSVNNPADPLNLLQ